MTPILHSHRVRRALLPLLLTACSSGSLVTKAPLPAARRSEPVTPLAREAAPGRARDGPATTLGPVLARSDAVVRGRLSRLTTVRGAEVGRIEPQEWLRGDPSWGEGGLTVLAGEEGRLPSAGEDSLFLLRARRESENWELVESDVLDGDDGPERLAAFREYLRIEALPDADGRLAELRTYLRGAVGSDREWTRWNAAREYQALARDLPESLAADDRAALEQARGRTRDRALRGVLDDLVAVCPGGRRSTTPSAAPAADPAADAALADFLARYGATGASAATRRQAVLDAAIRVGDRAAPLFARALGDPDASVREAAVAAVGQLRVASLEPRVAALLASEPSSAVRRSLVMAAGYLRSSASVPTLALLAKGDGAFAKDAAFALARVRDEAAVAALRKLRAEASDKERGDLLDFLLSERFLTQERALGEAR